MRKNIYLETEKTGARLKEARLAKQMTLSEFYTPITKHIGNCSSIESGRRRIGKRLSKEILEHHRINPRYLNTGMGEMFLKSDDPNEQLPHLEEGVPYFNINFSEMTFGELQVFQEPPEYYVNYRPFNDCDAYLPIYGDSMYPKFTSGEIIIVKEIRNRDVIQWGEAYLIVTDERANNITTVKLLFEHPNSEQIVLRSLNPDYKGDTVLQRAVIKRMFLVKGKVTRNHL
ncbi:LexA family transcriptional regulator [Pedobacter caeni]|uniref:Phage repressor protein C, contains Cro/C1-type HTH and peptisase s24 domains n=1 Tax=Pedobacter caeni TaxID=288992 RepID=A0A1M5N9F5_9SPHI|nr:S24 family peptidase [Pedobacter caeni]SHG86150.1 Phage repressor protein C, contains Cro/C1-type HTH and peptisase s24 domains [Pedobacter caeni]